MGIITDLISWSRETFVPLGPAGLFIISFIESSFFPIPPDLILIPLILAEPDLFIFFALIAAAGSVAGSLLGYFIGIKGGRPVLIKLVGLKKTEKAEKYFDKYGDWAILIASFTPVPYKVFTILSGILRHSIRNMFIVSAIGRTARFLMVATIIALWGEAIIIFVEQYLAIFTLIGIVAAVLIYWVYYRRKRTEGIK